MGKLHNILEDLKKKGIAFIKQFGIILLYFALVIMVQPFFLKDILHGNFIVTNIAYLTIELIVLTIFIFIFRKYIIPDYYDFKKNGKKYIKENFIYWIIGLIVMVFSNLIISSFIGLPSNEEANREILQTIPLYSVLSMVLFAPVIEELMTRTLLKNSFKHKIFYMIFSALIFGSLHLTSVNSNLEYLFIIPYGALGFALAKIYSKSNNIWTSIAFHALHNGIAILLLFMGV